MSSLEELVATSTVPEEERAVLVAALVAREDSIADALRMTGMRFGLYPEIVAETLAEVGLGSPVPEDERAMIRQNFIDLMNRLRPDANGG